MKAAAAVGMAAAVWAGGCGLTLELDPASEAIAHRDGAPADASGGDGRSVDAAGDAPELDARSLDANPQDTGSVPDGPVDGATADAPLDAMASLCGPVHDVLERCPLGTPVRLPISDPEAIDDDPSATDDLRELFFNSDRVGGVGEGDIWVSRRDRVDEPWGEPVLVAELSTAAHETTPEVSGDGLQIWWAGPGTGTGGGGEDIWTATRTARSSAWSTPRLVPALSSPGDERAPAVSRSELRMVLTREPSDSNVGNDLYLAVRRGRSDPWGTPAPIAELNTPGSEDDGFLSGGERLLFFGHNPVDADRDIVVAHRAALDLPFGTPAPVPGLNSPAVDTDPWVSRNLDYVLFSSDRDGNTAIYEATRAGETSH